MLYNNLNEMLADAFKEYTESDEDEIKLRQSAKKDELFCGTGQAVRSS